MATYDPRDISPGSGTIDMSTTVVGGGYTLGSITSPTSYTITNTGATSGTINYSTTATSTGWYTGSPVNITGNGITMPQDGDIKIGERSLKDLMVKMEERLAILVPDPKKLAKFEALKKAYDNYKLMEKLCQEDEDTN